jgi:hypothetical protein
MDSKQLEIETQLAQDLAGFLDDPLGFVMYAYPWDTDPLIQSVKLKEPWASRYKSVYGPDEWACRYLDDLGALVRDRAFDGHTAVEPIRMAVASGHGVGKSAMAGWLVDWILSTRMHSQGTVTANTFSQLETRTWAQIVKWTKMCVTAHWFVIGAAKIHHRDAPESWFCSAQTCREENSEAFAGQHAVNATSFYINDECSSIPDAIFVVQEGGLTDGEPMQFNFGNPTRNTGAFRECWRRQRHRWKTYRVDSRDVQITNKQHLQDMIDDYGLDSDVVKVRVLGSFPSQSAKQFIPEAIVDAARTRHLRGAQYTFAPKIIGVDPAWTGDDEFVIYFRQGLYSKMLGKWEKNDDDIHMASVIARFEDELRADAVHIDGGFGTGIVSAGSAMGRSWTLVWFSEKSADPSCCNKRAEMWNKLKKWLKAGGAIEDDDVLYQDLIGPELKPRLDGKIQLESKTEMQKRQLPSPNRADALALTFAYPVTNESISVLEQASPVQHDFDPYKDNADVHA